MFVINADYDCVINLENGIRFYVASDNTIKYKTPYEDWCKIGNYSTRENAMTALRLFSSHTSEHIYKFLTDDEVNKYHLQYKEKWHHATGKKTKDHGGS